MGLKVLQSSLYLERKEKKISNLEKIERAFDIGCRGDFVKV